MEGLKTTIAKGWFKFTKEDIFREAVNLYGVYELISGNGEILYVGVGNLRDELLTHLPSGSDPIMGASYFRYEVTENIDEAEKRQKALLDGYSKKHGELPRFNRKIRKRKS
ncbi:hypothetical protein PAP_02435 [Palaeococcus pacificus DY20341]|uniref:DUF7508 domain-containing protein n=1 Tax=Palaeococcus pacificus DY20341 TaxID=1343739 RepID=A0A075LSH0_9EURY|nr:hypothetical protein [Palaeococcus pacificus]AIF68917.1 hypothetical protein PAP_02435 [Palaeococcus pacificus DY20341]